MDTKRLIVFIVLSFGLLFFERYQSTRSSSK